MPATRNGSPSRTARRFLVIDAGNTSVHFGICTRSKVLEEFRVPRGAPRFLAEGVRELMKRIPARGALDGALVSSVVPRLNRALAGICWRAGIVPAFLNHTTPTGITLHYKKAREIGPDRIANAVAARELYGVPAIVVDIGTAITFDCVSRDGGYLGGIIAPGPHLSRAALAERTGLLPLVNVKEPPHLIGKSTVHAIQSGMIHGTRALIRGLVDELRRAMGGRPKVVFTGGQLELIIRGWEYPRLIDPLLTLHGLRIIFNRFTPVASRSS
jgi:type III pantothenate kinase